MKVILCECRLNVMGKREFANFWIDSKGKFRYKAMRGKIKFVRALVARWKKEGIIGKRGKRYKPEDGKAFLEALEMKFNGVFLQAFMEGAD